MESKPVESATVSVSVTPSPTPKVATAPKGDGAGFSPALLAAPIIALAAAQFMKGDSADVPTESELSLEPSLVGTTSTSDTSSLKEETAPTEDDGTFEDM